MDSVYQIGRMEFPLSDIKSFGIKDATCYCRPVYRLIPGMGNKLNHNAYEFVKFVPYSVCTAQLSPGSIPCLVMIKSNESREVKQAEIAKNTQNFQGVTVKLLKVLFIVTDKEYCFLGDGIDCDNIQTEYVKLNALKNGQDSGGQSPFGANAFDGVVPTIDPNLSNRGNNNNGNGKADQAGTNMSPPPGSSVDPGNSSDMRYGRGSDSGISVTEPDSKKHGKGVIIGLIIGIVLLIILAVFFIVTGKEKLKNNAHQPSSDITSSPTQTTTGEASTGDYYYEDTQPTTEVYYETGNYIVSPVGGAALTFYQAPNGSAETIGFIPPATPITVLEIYHDTAAVDDSLAYWGKIVYAGNIGWVSMSNIQKSNDPIVPPEESATAFVEESTGIDEPGSNAEATTAHFTMPPTNPPQTTKKPQEPTTKKQEPTTKKQEPTTKTQEPTTKKQEPTTKKQEPPATSPEDPFGFSLVVEESHFVN